MPMDPADFTKFQAHLARLGRQNTVCPFCGTRDWIAHGPLSMRTLEWEQLQAAGLIGPGPEVFATALLICKRCHFFYQFAWRPIELGGAGG
jgi:hypothetical protein